MFGTPPITKNLLIINILAFLAYMLLGKSINLNELLGLHFFLSNDFMPHQLITYMFMHANMEHIFFNMFALWMFGRIMEQYWGPKKFLIFYFVCGIGAGLCQELVQYIQYASMGLANYSMVSDGVSSIPMSTYLDSWTTVGASGAIYGILLGFGMSFPNERIFLLFPPIPIKAKWLVIGYAAIELVTGLASTNSGVAHFAHLGGMLFGLLLIIYWRKKAGINRDGFSSWSEYKPKESFWGKMRSNSHARGPHISKTSRRKKSEYTDFTETSASSASSSTSSSSSSMAQRHAEQAEIDRILDKVKKSGYGCLTDEEKKTIFTFRNR